MLNQKPTPHQEVTGRLALLGLAILLAGPATLLLVMGIAVVREAAESLRFFSMFFVGSAFLYLVAGSLVVLAFIPGTDARRGPPRGFTTLSAVFDGFWAFVRRILERW